MMNVFYKVAHINNCKSVEEMGDRYLEVFLLNHICVIHLADVVLRKFFVSEDIALLPVHEISA